MSFVSTKKLAGISVLVVEDDTDSRELSIVLLEEAGATVTACGTVPETLDALNGLSPDALVVDIGLPEYNGYAFIGRVRALDDPNKRNLPAIALTAFATATDRDIALRSGFQAFLTKPYDANELIETIANAVAAGRKAAA